MPAYLTFTNKSPFPLISVYSENRPIAENILTDTTTKRYKLNSGSVELTVKNCEKPFLSLWLSLYPNKEYNLTIDKASYNLST